MIVPVDIDIQDVEVIKQALGDTTSCFYDWGDAADVGDAIEELIQIVLPRLI